MNNSNLDTVAENLLDSLLFIRNSIFNEKDFIRNFPNPPKEVQQYMDNFPMPPSHIKVILYLENSKSSPISQIAKNLKISKSNMTPIIDKLIDYGLVIRYPDSIDRRILRVELTPKALTIFQSFRQCAKNSICVKLSKLSQNDLITLENSLVNITTLFKKIVKD